MSEPREVRPAVLSPRPTTPKNEPVEEVDESKLRRLAPFYSINRGQDSVTGDADVRFVDFTPVPAVAQSEDESEEADLIPKAEPAPEPASSVVSGEELQKTVQTEASPVIAAPPPPVSPVPAPASAESTPPSPSDDLLPDSSSVKKIG